MKLSGLALAIALCSCLCLSAGHVESGSSWTGFIVFSDTHVGRGLGSDGFTASQRLQLLLNYTLQYKNTMLVNLGDLTDSWNLNSDNERFYNLYQNLTAGRKIVSLKGNHDCNLTLFESKFGSVNWYGQSNNIFYCGIGSLNEDGTSWLQSGVSFSSVTYKFLDQAVKSLEYNSTAIHFLFLHFAPDSTWPTNATYGVSAKLAGYYRYFSVIFHGHEGGGESVRVWNNQSLTVHTSHLGDGKNSTDTLLFVHVNTADECMVIVSHNFVSNVKMEVYHT